MCNPRRVNIHLTREIENAWRRTVEAVGQASGEVSELARLTADIAMDAEMGDAALVMLGRVLRGEFAGFDPWDEGADGLFSRDLGEVILIYNPRTRRLSIEAQLTELVSAEAGGAAEASGFTVGEVAAEAVGNYYSDGWGGRTRERAETEAQAKAETQLTEAIEALHYEQNRETLDSAQADAQAQADAEAQAALAARQAEMRAALRRRLQSIVANAQDSALRVMNRAVGEAYRQTLLQLMHDNGGRVITDEQTGSVINLELELY